MPWEPTTRGVNGDLTLCDITGCVLMNERTEHCSSDFLETRYFCLKHWAEICEFFAFVRKCPGCTRSHEAEIGQARKHLDMIKFQLRAYEPCDKNLEDYFDKFASPIW
jgi:hypothetical protein